MNKVFLIGNLTRDPELTETSGGIKICRFAIAVNRRSAGGAPAQGGSKKPQLQPFDDDSDIPF